MKKTLLTIFGAALTLMSSAQTNSPSWSTIQNTNFPIVSAGIKFLDAVDNNVVWAVGYDGTAPGRNYNWFTRSIDGGNTFVSAPIFSSSATPGIGDTSLYVLANLDAINANTAWVSAYTKAGGGSKGGIFKTTDGGQNWVKSGPAAMYSNSASFCNLVVFLDGQVGITQGDPNSTTSNEYEIWRTTDGGLSWTLVPGANIPNPTSGEFGLVNVYEKNGNTNLWMGTNKGRILRSTDAGLNWNVSTVTDASIAATSSVNDIAFSSPMNGVAYVFTGTTPNFTFTMYNTTDGGATWSLIPTVDPNVGRADISPIPGTNILASAGSASLNNVISYSNDNGVTWNNWGGAGIQYLTVDFVSPTVGWAGTFSDNANSSLEGLFKFSDTPLSTNAFAGFNLSSGFDCAPSTVTVTGNFSTGTPAPTYSWSVSPAATISNPTTSTPDVTFTNPGTYTVTLTATSGTSSSVAYKVVQIANCTGIIDNNTALASVNVFPNPTKNMVNVQVENTEAYTLTMFNVLGEVVISKNIVNQDNVMLDLSSQSKGVYFLSIENKGTKTTKKIILE